MSSELDSDSSCSDSDSCSVSSGESIDSSDSCINEFQTLVTISRWRFTPSSHSFILEKLDFNRDNHITITPFNSPEMEIFRVISQSGSLKNTDIVLNVSSNFDNHYDVVIGSLPSRYHCQNFSELATTRISIFLNDRPYGVGRFFYFPSFPNHSFDVLRLVQIIPMVGPHVFKSLKLVNGEYKLSLTIQNSNSPALIRCPQFNRR